MGTSTLRGISETCGRLRQEFSDSCMYRTCHYRHSLLDMGLELAGRMADELSHKGNMDDETLYRTISRFASALADAVADREGDAHLYGAMHEVSELAFRQARRIENARYEKEADARRVEAGEGSEQEAR